MSASTAAASDARNHAPQVAHAPLLNVFMQVSVALALVLLVRDLLLLAPLDHALLTAAGTGLVLYAALVGGYFAVRRILDATPEAPPAAQAAASAAKPAPDAGPAAEPVAPAAPADTASDAEVATESLLPQPSEAVAA